MKAMDLRAAGLSDDPKNWTGAPAHDPVSGEVVGDEPTPKWFQDGRVHSIEELDWAGEKLAEYERAVAENRRLLEKAIERLSARTSRLNEPYMREIEKFRIAIEIYAQANRDSILIGQRKSRTLPGGLTLRWRSGGGHLRRIERDDGTELLRWAKARCPSAVVVRESVDVMEIKRFAEEFRALPPGMERVPESESLDISVKEEP